MLYFYDNGRGNELRVKKMMINPLFYLQGGSAHPYQIKYKIPSLYLIEINTVMYTLTCKNADMSQKTCLVNVFYIRRAEYKILEDLDNHIWSFNYLTLNEVLLLLANLWNQNRLFFLYIILVAWVQSSKAIIVCFIIIIINIVFDFWGHRC